MKRIYITITALFLGFTMLNAQTITVYPSDDMTTNSGSSTMFPSNEQLWVANLSAMQNFHQTLIKFDLSPYMGQTITSAKLNLYQFFHAPDGTPTPSKLYAITENWNESTWPTSNNVTHGETEYASSNFTSDLNWYVIDVTDLVNSWLNASVENNGLVIISDLGTKFAEFYSKDAADQSKHPFLEIAGTTGISDINTYVDNFLVFPNPVSDKVTVDFNLLTNQQVEVAIFNALGIKVLHVCDKLYKAGRNIEIISCDNIKTGIYFLRLQTNGAVLNKKIIIK